MPLYEQISDSSLGHSLVSSILDIRSGSHVILCRVYSTTAVKEVNDLAAKSWKVFDMFRAVNNGAHEDLKFA